MFIFLCLLMNTHSMLVDMTIQQNEVSTQFEQVEQYHDIA